MFSPRLDSRPVCMCVSIASSADEQERTNGCVVQIQSPLQTLLLVSLSPCCFTVMSVCLLHDISSWKTDPSSLSLSEVSSEYRMLYRL